MNNDRIDLSRESLNNEGNIWLNRKTKQLRTSLGKNEPNSWYNPISSYEVGSENKLRRGQPVSVGYLDQLYSESKLSGDSCIVPTNPSINQWCIGLALEPGFHRDGNSVKKIHVQSNGQIEYDLSTKDDDDYYLPPHSDTKFEWNYDDVGKPVFVSNKNPGELTLDIAEAAYNGGTIVCVGRIADAPLEDEKNISLQKIVLEVQLSGDVRGVVDTSQIQVEIASKSKHASLGIQVENLESDLDRVFFFFIKDGFAYFILDDETVNKYSQNSPVGALVVNSKDGVLDIESLLGKKTLVFRLGLLKGNFGFSKIGNTAYLSNGFIDESAASSSYDYKVGLILSKDSILIDCRYPRFVAKKTMIGDIKPLFENGLCEPGYAKIDNEVHKVVFDKNDPVCADGIDWKYLVEGTYTKDLFVFSRSKDGPFTTILEGGWTPDGANEDSTGFLNKYTYFKFRDLVYTIGDNTCGCQIKFSKDDAPEAMNYIWPEQTFELSLVPDPGREDDENYVLGGNLSSSKLKLDISKLTALGQYMDSNGQNIEAYDIIVREKTSNQLISSGFYQVESDGQMKWCGYEWKISRDSYTNQTFLTMITVPGEEPNSKCLGFCWPIGQKLINKVDLYVTVRRRPTQYHDLYLNQINQNNPWAPYTDGNNLITGDSIFFGAKLKETPADSGVGQNSGYNKENIGTGEIHFSSSNNEGSINTIITEPDSNENRIKVFYDIKSIATRTNNDEIRRYIKWGYNFEDNVTSLSSAFAPSLVQPSTKKENLFGTKPDGSNTFIQNYNDNALQILHEFQAKIINYIDDDRDTVDNWGKISLIFDDVYNSQFNENEYVLFDNANVESVKYKISDSIKEALSDTKSYLYGNSNGYMSYISSIGLLSTAAKNTQDRLLKIERALFGSDFYSNPAGKADKYNEEYVDIDETISNGGLLREVDSLKDMGLILEHNDSRISLKKSKGYSSFLRDIFITNYSDYDDLQTFNAQRDSFDLNSDVLYLDDNPKNHLYTLWTDYCFNRKTNVQLKFVNSFITGNISKLDYSKALEYYSNDFMDEPSSISANKIYLSKYLKQYNNETKTINNTLIGVDKEKSVYAGSPLFWPLNIDDDFSNIDYYDVFYNNYLCGLDDASEEKESSFNAISLEGLILDIYSKLTYLRNKFDFDGTYKASILKKFNRILSNKKFKIEADYFSLEDGAYSAISFKNKEILKGYYLKMRPTTQTTYFGNGFKYNTYIGDRPSYEKYLEFIRKFNSSNTKKKTLFGVTLDLNNDIYKLFALYGLCEYVELIKYFEWEEPEKATPFKLRFIKALALLGVQFPYRAFGMTPPEDDPLANIPANVIINTDLRYIYRQYKSTIDSLLEPYYLRFAYLDNVDTSIYLSKVVVSGSVKKDIKEYYNAILNCSGYRAEDSELKDILKKPISTHQDLCILLFPEFASSDLQGSLSYNIQIYETKIPINSMIVSTCNEILSENDSNKFNGIFVDYENTTDHDQLSLDDKSNNINNALFIDVKEDEESLKLCDNLKKIDPTKEDIILNKKTQEIFHRASDGSYIIIDNSQGKITESQLFHEDKLMVESSEVPKNSDGTATDKIYINLSSSKSEFDKYTQSLNLLLGGFKDSINEQLSTLRTSINNIQKRLDDAFVEINKKYDSDHKINFPAGTTLEELACSVSSLNNPTSDMSLSVGTSKQRGVSISKVGRDIDIIRTRFDDIEYTTDAFFNQMNKTMSILRNKVDDDDNTYKEFYIDEKSLISEALDNETTYNNIRAALNNYCQITQSMLTVPENSKSVYTLLNNYIETMKTMNPNISFTNNFNIAISKARFIDSLDLLSRKEYYSKNSITPDEIETLFETIKSEIYSYLDNKDTDNKLTLSSKIKPGYTLHGKQQKIPSILFNAVGNDIVELTRPEYYEGKESYVHDKSTDVVEWKSPIQVIYEDVFGRNIEFSYNNSHTVIQSLTGIAFTDSPLSLGHTIVQITEAAKGRIITKQLVSQAKNYIFTPTFITKNPKLFELNQSVCVYSNVAASKEQVVSESTWTDALTGYIHYGAIDSEYQNSATPITFGNGTTVKIDFKDKIDFILDSTFVLLSPRGFLSYGDDGSAKINSHTSVNEDYNDIVCKSLRELGVNITIK